MNCNCKSPIVAFLCIKVARHKTMVSNHISQFFPCKNTIIISMKSFSSDELGYLKAIPSITLMAAYALEVLFHIITLATVTKA